MLALFLKSAVVVGASVAAFPRHLSRRYPLSYRPLLLCLLCADETSNALWIIWIPFPALIDTAQGRYEERSALLLPGHYCASVVGTVSVWLRVLLSILLMSIK